jgi:hypothetical protein
MRYRFGNYQSSRAVWLEEDIDAWIDEQIARQTLDVLPTSQNSSTISRASSARSIGFQRSAARHPPIPI